jgi:uncharacterized lipoprotein
MKKISKRLLLVLAAMAVLVLAGCDDDKGPMQTAGEKVDNAAATTGNAVKGAAEKTGHAVKGAANTTGNAVKGAADKTGEAVENVTK